MTAVFRGSVLVLLATLAGCHPADDRKTADAAIATFHRELNAGQFVEIYRASAPEMQSGTTQEQFVQFAAAVHRKLGNFRTGAQSGWNDSYLTGGHYLAIGYAAVFDRDKAFENFTFHFDNGRPVLAGYHVNSNALVLN